MDERREPECPLCRFRNPASMRFCVECGEQLVVECPECGAEMLRSYKFCGQCGTALNAETALAPATGAPRPAPPPPAGSSPPRPAGERKPATVLVCELTVSTAGSEPLDPDRLHGLLNGFFELAQSEVERYGGTINRFLDQGFMALFGAPVAHEDHARRGVLAALGIAAVVERDTEAEARSGVSRRPRMGLATGPVVVGGMGTTAIGEATVTASRLQQRARPGAILASGGTADLVRPQVDLNPEEPLPGDDRHPSVEVFRVVETGTGAWTLRDTALSPFVGRERELAALEELREQASRGHGQVVGLAGEAGAGKSRLLHEFFQRSFPGKRVSYLRGQCQSWGGGVPLLPLVDMIRKASRIKPADAPASVAAKMRSSLEAVGTDPEESLPYYLRLLGIGEGTEDLDDLEPQALQARTFAAMRRMLLDAGSRSLVVMEIEDVHWIDETSDAFLDSLVEVMGAARLLLVLTYRSGYQPRWLEKSYATQVTLRSLSDEESRHLIRSVLARGGRSAEELDDDVLEKAEGNPLFLEELARSIVEQEGGAAIPNTIQGILMARIDRLPEEHKHLLRTASILGREFSLDLLERLWDRSEPLSRLLEDLRNWELLYKAPSEDRTLHFFKHALTQEVAYESLLTPQRRELHSRAVRVLEELHGDHLEDVFDQLVFHTPRAGDPAKTVHYLTLFAQQAVRTYAHAEAAKALREALEQAAGLGDDVRARRQVEVLLLLAESLLPLAQFPETLELCQRYGEVVEALGDPALSAQYYFWLAHTHTYLGNQEETRRFARRSIDQARECGDETIEGKANYVLGRDGFWSGQFRDGITASLRAVVLLERSGEPWWQGPGLLGGGLQPLCAGRFRPGHRGA